MTVTRGPRVAAAERPPISGPRRARRASRRSQPRLGLLGLLLVVPIAALLAVGAGGADGSVLVLGPLVTFSLPLVAMVAFWWEDWPGTRLRPSWSGWADTALIVAGAVVLTGVGQVVVADLDLRSMFDPSPGPGHVPTFPATMPLGRRRVRGDAAADARRRGMAAAAAAEDHRRARGPRVAWAVALVVYFALADVRRELGTVLVLIGAWQVLFYVAWRGWPFSTIARRSLRLPCAHVVVIGGGIVTFLVAHDVFSVGLGPLAAFAACFVAAGLLVRHAVRGLARPGRRPCWPRLRSPRSSRSRCTRSRTACTSRARPRTNGSRTSASTPWASRSSCTSRSAAAGRSRRSWLQRVRQDVSPRDLEGLTQSV